MTSTAYATGASSRTYAFADPHLYGRALRGGEAEIVIAGKGEFRAALTAVDFERLWMQRADETAERIAWARNAPSRSPILFLATMDQAPMIDCGLEVSPGDILFPSEGVTHHMRTASHASWGAMSLTPADLAAAGRAILGCELSAPAATRRLRPAPALMSRLLELHREAGRLATTSPQLLSRPGVAHALEQQLVHAMVHCLADGTGIEASVGNRGHAATLARIENLLAANVDQPLYVAEICATVGVSERTLRLCCQEHLGMGPKRYLWLRRMNLAHRSLLGAMPAKTTVTDIATGCGFWELGRFAARYRTLFGESPSVTLARVAR